VRDEGGIASVLEGSGKLFGEPDLLVELANRQQTGIRRQGSGGKLDIDWSRREEIE
jgi:hypothetical protein